MLTRLLKITPMLILTAIAATASPGEKPSQHVPSEAPRTWVLANRAEAFREYTQSGEGAIYLNNIKRDLDKYWMDWPLPEEPETYGDPDPKKRTSEMVDKWRGMQDLTGQITGVAEAATLVWIVTGEEKYLEKAKSFLLGVSEWDPLGASGIDYNDEAHFRLLRKMPEVYDQIRDHLTKAEKAKVLEHFRVRGERNLASIIEHGTAKLKRNSVEQSPASHSVRFMPMTAQAALALWDDLDEAKEWWNFVYTWYRDVFTPWGGDAGGWAEGPAYWRGVYEHAVFQDILLSIDDPLAYSQPFWKNTGYFMVYFVQPYMATGFGDLSNAGQFDMEPGVKHFIGHLARATGNGYFESWTDLYEDPRALPIENGMEKLYRVYPTTAEYMIRDFIASSLAEPEDKPLSDLPGSRYFDDIGWVSMHSALGEPEEDIQLSFKSSPYGSFSHSHADQNAFIINAFGEQLAINAGYREYHRSQMHKYYTRHTLSKNAILINRRGQETQDKSATGKIVRYVVDDRYVWTTGDATVAYNTLQKESDSVKAAIRDIVFIDNRYFVTRDHVQLDDPGRIDWLIHAKEPITFHNVDGSFVIQQNNAFLFGRLAAWKNDLSMETITEFPIQPDAKYKDMDFIQSQVYLVEPAVDQAHLQASTHNDRAEQIIFSVLWPSENAKEASDLRMEMVDKETIKVFRPDGKMDTIKLTDEALLIK